MKTKIYDLPHFRWIPEGYPVSNLQSSRDLFCLLLAMMSCRFQTLLIFLIDLRKQK